MESSSDILYRNAESCLSAGDFEKAKLLYGRLLADDLFNNELKDAIIYCGFWAERKKIYDSLPGHIRKGKYLSEQWQSFTAFTAGWGSGGKGRTADCIRRRIFGRALYNFTSARNETRIADGELLYHIGICHKRLGSYGEAASYLENASFKQQQDAAILAELADCLALLGKEEKARFLFREAFYINPSVINPDLLESGEIRQVAETAAGMGYSGMLLREWIPVIGVRDGYLNVKREIKDLEFRKLRQDILELEEKLDSSDGDRELTIPRLINKYLRLIDFYETRNNIGGKKDTLSKIRGLSPDFFEYFYKKNGDRLR